MRNSEVERRRRDGHASVWSDQHDTLSFQCLLLYSLYKNIKVSNELRHRVPNIHESTLWLFWLSRPGSVHFEGTPLIRCHLALRLSDSHKTDHGEQSHHRAGELIPEN